ncbi:response regulator [Streptomyces sp. NPDC005065]|uniref:response regulator n=1 Tax=Streptomyces sp. NPDC005065 TaxID=3154461 RepID=UPI0033AFC372
MRVLIVEDEPYLAEAVRDGLRLEAIAADIAGDGDSALELLSVNSYDLAVLDRDIPGHSGDEVARRIVASGSGIPILMHRFGQDLLLWGILAMAWLMGQRELGLRVAYEGVSSWRGSVLIFTVFLLVMVAVALGLTDRIRWKWLVTAGCLTYPLYLMHYVTGTTLVSRLHDAMDARLLVALVIAGFLLLSWLAHRLVERPVAQLLKRALESSFTRLRSFGRPA